MPIHALKNNFVAKLTLCSFAILGGIPAHAQEPSYDETVRFITEHLTHSDVLYGIVDGKWSYQDQRAFFPERCVLHTDDRIKQDGSHYGQFGYKIDLSKINADFIEINQYSGHDGAPAHVQIELRARDRNKTSMWAWYRGKWDAKGVNGISQLHVRGDQAGFYGSRVGKALIHLAKICGAQGELF